MRKITKPKQKCSKCSSIIQPEKYEDFCDMCGKKIDWDSKTRLPFDITFIMNSGNYKKVNFCSVKCMFKWLLKNGKKTLRHKYDFFTLEYWDKKNIDKLLNLIDKKKLK